jgi:hypothetical protein
MRFACFYKEYCRKDHRFYMHKDIDFHNNLPLEIMISVDAVVQIQLSHSLYNKGNLYFNDVSLVVRALI